MKTFKLGTHPNPNSVTPGNIATSVDNKIYLDLESLYDIEGLILHVYCSADATLNVAQAPTLALLDTTNWVLTEAKTAGASCSYVIVNPALPHLHIWMSGGSGTYAIAIGVKNGRNGVMG